MRWRAAGLVPALVLAGSCAPAQPAPEPATPADSVDAHLAAAREAAGYEHADLYDHLCSRLIVGRDMPAGRIPQPDNYRSPENFAAEPVKVFDNLYYLGEALQYGATPSAWAITTSEGIVLIDALFADSVEQQVVGGLRTLGLDPSQIKYAVATHAHGDHIGGMKYLQDQFGTRVVMSEADWDALEANANFREPKPTRDRAVTDGQQLTLGDTTITLYVTPGHTPGTLSMLIPLRDGTTEHLAALWGGTGMHQFSTASYHEQAIRFRGILEQAGADVLLTTHPELDRSDIKLPLVKKRQAGQPHPYVIGTDLVRRYLTVAVECSAAGLLMEE